MWYSNARIYPGSDGAIVGVALAGKIWYTKENTKIIRIPTHHTGKLELIIANDDVSLSVMDPTLLLANAPRKIPIIEIIIVAVVKSRIVLGNFSSKIY